MQPHSMAVQTLTAYAWGCYELPNLEGARIRVTYRRHNGENRSLIYVAKVMDLSIKKAVINVIREEGGINCTITIVRKSAIEGTRTIAEHSQQHRSGLRELSEMSNKRIEDGHHRNSLVYNRFSAVAAAEDRMNWKFPSDVITQDKKSFRKINYLVKIENLYMG